MFFKSIRFKALLWYTLFLTITLCTFSVILYESFNKVLYDDFDDLLSLRAEGIVDSINTYWHAKGPRGTDNESFIAVARSWVEEKRKDPELMSVYVQILNNRGQLLVASKSMPSMETISKEDFADIVGGDEDFDTVSGALAGGKPMKFRVYSKPVVESGKTEYVVQVAGPISLVSLAVGNLKLILFLALPLTVLLAAIPGVILVRLTLKPVDKMVDTIKQITAENLRQKIHIPDTKDEIKRLADTFNDMIDRVERSFSSQQRFIRGISRELEMPVKKLKEEIEAVLERKTSAEEYNTLVVKSLKKIDSFSRTIEDLVIMSQPDGNRVLAEIRKVNLTRLVEQAFGEMKDAADEKDITTSLFCGGDIKVDGDKEQLGQLVENLLDNAVKYTYRKGRISVSVSPEGGNVKIEINDTGIGIPEDEIPYIFDRFYQVARMRASKNGFGLGLSNAKSIAEAHKGSISVESQPGKGSTFTVMLPVSYPV